MYIDILTLFPQAFTGAFDFSIVGRARERSLVDIKLYDIREYTHDRHHVVDDYPYGGGAGMVMKPEPLFEAVEAIRRRPDTPVILLTPQGRLLTQEITQDLATYEGFMLICGHYEGVDERVIEHLVSDEISIGDYVLSGGEMAAMVVVDAVVRLLPGAVGCEQSVLDDSHTDNLLEYPQYTRPPDFRQWPVPEVLLSGNHARIAQWRRQQSLLRTALRRPDLLEKASLNEEDRLFLKNAGLVK